jgi:ABC-type amino acid transport substrate-binding protein
MYRTFVLAFITTAIGCMLASQTQADLTQIKQAGVLRHLGIPYSNFVTGDGDGLDVEILKMYAAAIGVQYRHVPTTWESVISDLSGKTIIPRGDEVEILGKAPVKGDIIGNGLTVLPWRKKVIHFSSPYFPSAIWVVAGANSDLKPIKPSGDHAQDVIFTKRLLEGRQLLGIRDTCLDPDLYNLPGCIPRYKDGLQLNDLPGAIIKGEYELTLQDAPDALLALVNYPGKVKVIGPITEEQVMAFGISQDSPELLESFNAFLGKLRDSGKLKDLIVKYYPLIVDYFPNVAH